MGLREAHPRRARSVWKNQEEKSHEEDLSSFVSRCLRRYGCNCCPDRLRRFFRFTGAGTEGGSRLAEIVERYGASLIFYGLLLTFIPMAMGFFLSQRLFRLSALNGLAAMTGGMTSTPALAALIQTSGTTDVASTYATTYPIALINMVLVMQILARV